VTVVVTDVHLAESTTATCKPQVTQQKLSGCTEVFKNLHKYIVSEVEVEVYIHCCNNQRVSQVYLITTQNKSDLIGGHERVKCLSRFINCNE